MALAKQSANSGTFGRRGVDASPRVRPASVRKPTVSGRPEARTAEAAAQAADAIARDVGTAASRGKAYAYACLSGATTFLAVLFILSGVESRFFQSGPMLFLLAIPVLPTLALALYIPTVVLSDLARLLSIPRGWSDIGIGFVLGLGVGIAYAVTAADAKSLATAVAITAGGIVGGWAFWRAQGYPGLSRAGRDAAEIAYHKIK
ncbi:hypothetical protein W911_12005 [Hyphomicrobium nitrativorans NL23]|uniref:Uncharacterized protein n=1 Tax=Hyphomicrobium nitrativorans NL23 TaxID=1029756 RepID=V5SJT6_9HYPH|nr:hypothetical protein [Hyphomicrobium nitrativorans]AHB50239.1 hypothetical protein W911_12005 [Hyphomicrobium nitrativorans NL23]